MELSSIQNMLLVVSSYKFGPFTRNMMAERINKDELVSQLAARMHTDEATATAWVDGIVETLYESFKDGKGVTLPGFGGFYVRPEPESWVFKFNPGQRLRALFGWSSTYSGKP